MFVFFLAVAISQAANQHEKQSMESYTPQHKLIEFKEVLYGARIKESYTLQATKDATVRDLQARYHSDAVYLDGKECKKGDKIVDLADKDKVLLIVKSCNRDERPGNPSAVVLTIIKLK